MGDKEIIKLLKSNKTEGIELLIERYRGLVWYITNKVLYHREQDIEECIADTFVSIWKYRDKLNDRALKGLLVCTARNTALNRYKKLCKTASVPIDDIELAADIDIALQVERHFEFDELYKLVMAMNEPDRGIFLRRHYMMQSYKEIAEELGLNEKQICNRLYQCKMRLRKQLKVRSDYD